MQELTSTVRNRNAYIGNTHINVAMQALCPQVLEEKYWQNLHTQIDLLDAKILEKLYIPDTEPQLLCILFKMLKTLNYSKETIRNRVYRLRDVRLLQVLDKTNPLVIWPIEALKGNVKTMLTLYYARLGLSQSRDFYE